MSREPACLFQKLSAPEWVFHRHAEILLAWIQIFRPNARAACALRRSHNHAIVKMDAVGCTGFYGPADGFPIQVHQWNRPERVQDSEQAGGPDARGHPVKKRGCKLAQHL